MNIGRDWSLKIERARSPLHAAGFAKPTLLQLVSPMFGQRRGNTRFFCRICSAKLRRSCFELRRSCHNRPNSVAIGRSSPGWLAIGSTALTIGSKRCLCRRRGDRLWHLTLSRAEVTKFPPVGKAEYTPALYMDSADSLLSSRHDSPSQSAIDRVWHRR